MRNKINLNYFESFSNELISKFGRINQLISDARGAIGDYHEELLKTSLNNFLSDRYTVKTGYIYYDKDNISNQTDILIIDENYSFSYLYQEGDFVIVKPEPVICAIEVKSKIDKKSFEKAFLNIVKAKKIKQKTLTGGLLGLIFGYKSNRPTNNNLEKWFLSSKINSEKNEPSFWPNGILLLHSGELLVLDSNSKCYMRLYKEIVEKQRNLEINRSFKLSVFISWILGALGGNEISASGKIINNNHLQLIDSENMKLGIDQFKVGEKRSLRTI